MSATERSISGQFPFWRELADSPLRAKAGEQHVLVGCGTSYFLAQSIAAQMNANGIAAIAAPGHEWTTRPQSYVAGGPVTVVAISRSGESTETVAALRASKARGQTVVALSCEPQSALVAEADRAIVARTHPEEGIVMTASASLMLLMGLQFAGTRIDPAGLAGFAEGQMQRLAKARLELLLGREHLVFLGGGALYGMAAEGALKVQEMSYATTQVFHPLEYRHGPISLVDSKLAAVMLYSAEDQVAEARVTAEIQALGGLVIGIGGPGDIELSALPDQALRGIGALPALQWLGLTIASQRGVDTTSPRNLTKVVRFA